MRLGQAPAPQAPTKQDLLLEAPASAGDGTYPQPHTTIAGGTPALQHPIPGAAGAGHSLTPSNPHPLKPSYPGSCGAIGPDMMMRMNQHQIDELVAAATEVRNQAHAPYSGYLVGSAVLTTDGRVFTGCNVENASYGLSICAERHAVAAAVAAGCRDFAGIAVVTQSDPPAAPCGACRQVLAEFGDFPVILAGLDGQRESTTVKILLPLAFDPATLAAASEEDLDSNP